MVVWRVLAWDVRWRARVCALAAWVVCEISRPDRVIVVWLRVRVWSGRWVGEVEVWWDIVSVLIYILSVNINATSNTGNMTALGQLCPTPSM